MHEKVIISVIKITATKNPHKHSDIEGMRTNGFFLPCIIKLGDQVGPNGAAFAV